MTSRLPAWLLCLAAALAATPAAAQAPADQAAFTRDLAERLRSAMPGERIEVAGPLQLGIDREPEDGEINLGRIWNFCAQAGPAECEATIAHFVTTVAAALGDQAPLTREQLRVAVRHTDFCDDIGRRAAEAGRGQYFVTRPAAPQLCAVLMADYPEAMRALDSSDLDALGLEAGAAWALAERQTFAGLPQPDTLEGLADNVVAVTEFDYVPSLLLNLDGWRRAAAAAGGELIVAVPSDGFLIVGRRDLVTDLAGFAATTREGFAAAERGISPLVYRWTGTGWAPIE